MYTIHKLCLLKVKEVQTLTHGAEVFLFQEDQPERKLFLMAYTWVMEVLLSLVWLNQTRLPLSLSCRHLLVSWEDTTNLHLQDLGSTQDNVKHFFEYKLLDGCCSHPAHLVAELGYLQVLGGGIYNSVWMNVSNYSLRNSSVLLFA